MTKNQKLITERSLLVYLINQCNHLSGYGMVGKPKYAVLKDKLEEMVKNIDEDLKHIRDGRAV